MLSKPIEPTAEMMADIRARLGRICQNYTAEEFDTLVRQIALVRIKYDSLRDETFFSAARFAVGRQSASGQPPDHAHIAEPRS